MSLYYETVSKELRQLLVNLMEIPELNSFYLVGGTSLALRYGHRVSVDIDLFTHEPFDAAALQLDLKERFELTQSVVADNTVTGIIHNIKADFIAHRYPLIGGVQKIDDLRILSVEDIAAMKLNAIANRGSKKDFYDVYELLQHYTLEKMLEYYAQKYPEGSVWNVEKSLTYFDDAEAEPDPVVLKNRTWEQIKKDVLKVARLA